MKKVLATLAFVFATAFAIGFTSSSKVEAANCYYTCTPCNGGRYCCVNNGVTTCKPTNKIQCPLAYWC